MLKQDEHDDLRGSSHQNIIPYVHGENYCIAMCVIPT
jgi:hypothetical protein